MVAIRAKKILSQFCQSIQNKNDWYAIQPRKNGHPRPVSTFFWKCLGVETVDSFIPRLKHREKWHCRGLWQKFSNIERGVKLFVGWVDWYSFPNWIKIRTHSWPCSDQSLFYIYNTLHTSFVWKWIHMPKHFIQNTDNNWIKYCHNIWQGFLGYALVKSHLSQHIETEVLIFFDFRFKVEES